METYTLTAAAEILTFDAQTGRLVNLQPLDLPRVVPASAEGDPAFAVQLLSPEGQFSYYESTAARELVVTCEVEGGEQRLTIAGYGVGGLELDVTLTVTAHPERRHTRWSCRARNDSGLELVDVQFPFITLPADEEVAVLQPAMFGSLTPGSALPHLPEDAPQRWQLVPENGSSPHYPGRVFAQFLAWLRGGHGVYLACEDTAGNVKMIAPVRRGDGVRLGVAHVGDWPSQGERTLEYEVVLGCFRGDWYDAADLYRSWSLRQHWATPLTERTDVPAWLLESPPHITIRLQGYLDDGPTDPVEEFLPYEKCVPLLERVAADLESPLVAVLMSWERGGPWVYPDCFPPVGGDESLARFAGLARERGWQVGSFCNGTRWVVRHLYNDYDGWEYFHQNHGEQGVCRRHDGELWAEGWDGTWRPSFITCMVQEQTRQLARDFVRRLIGWGMTSIQFFDQNCNAATFPCYATDHGHPRIPGKWMAQAMRDMIEGFREAAAEAGETEVIQSTENPCNEFCLPLFQQSDLRISPPSAGFGDFVPVYHYLFHECTLLHGMMSTGPEPHSLTVRHAWLAVWGEMAGAVLTGDGTLLNKDTFNWADWEPHVGSNEDALAIMRSLTALRRGPGRDFLVYGRMQRPAEVEGIEVVAWEHNGRCHEVPAVAHAAWQAPDGRPGVALSNWTNEARTVTVMDPRLRGELVLHVAAAGVASETVTDDYGAVEVTLPPLSCAILEGQRA